MCERYLHRCHELSVAIRAYAMSAVGIDVVSVHTLSALSAYRVLSAVRIDVAVIWNTAESQLVSKDSRMHCKVQMNE